MRHLSVVFLGVVSCLSAQTTIEQISGLRTELDVRPVKSPFYFPGRSAVVTTNGQLGAAVGDPSDCIRVDGTAVPCTSGGQVVFVDEEVPSGIIDGSNRTFTLTSVPSGGVQIALNGVLQRRSSDFTLNNNVLTFAQPLRIGDSLLAWYRVGGTRSAGNRSVTTSWDIFLSSPAPPPIQHNEPKSIISRDNRRAEDNTPSTKAVRLLLERASPLDDGPAPTEPLPDMPKSLQLLHAATTPQAEAEEDQSSEATNTLGARIRDRINRNIIRKPVQQRRKQ